MKILLVEDSKLDRRLVCRHLEESGLKFAVCENGTDAWELLQGPDAPTLVLLDWVVPGIDGIELCRLGGHPVLAESALKAVKNWKYARANEESNTTVEVKF